MSLNDVTVEIYSREKCCGAEALKRNLGCDFVVYAYHDDGYSGYGFAILKINNLFYYHNMGHCSCYGGFDEFKKGIGCESLSCLKNEWIKDNFYSKEQTTEIDEVLEILKEQWGDYFE